MRIIELPETIVKDIKDYVVMRNRRDTKIGELHDRYEYLVSEVTQRVEDQMYDQWLDEEVEVGVNPIFLREAASQLAEETIESYSQQIMNECARNLLKFIFTMNEPEDQE